MWLVAEFLPTSLFSLRASNATNAAAKTLLLPSPYCVKMALLDASYRRDGVATTEARFEWIRDLEIRFEVPQHAVVNTCFVKIQKWNNDAWGSTFALREYVFYQGTLKIAFTSKTLGEEWREQLPQLLLHINQLGKRGCFMQLLAPPELLQQELPVNFAVPLSNGGLRGNVVLQPLDEMQPKAKLAQVNNFTSVSVTKAAIRTSVATGVPYQRHASSRSFDYYRRS